MIPLRDTSVLCYTIVFILDQDECAGGNFCDANATCNNTDGSYTCDCKTGFIGDGFTCNLISKHSCSILKS